MRNASNFTILLKDLNSVTITVLIHHQYILSLSILKLDVIKNHLRQKGVHGVSVQNLANIQGTGGFRTSLSAGV